MPRVALAAGLAALVPAAGHAAPRPPPASNGVSEVVVQAKAPDVQILPDRKVYAIGADLQAAAGTAADVLNGIPSVEVNADGGVTLRGDSKVTILIDGKPQAQVQGANAGLGLTQLSAADIVRIEIMTNPPPQYKAEGSAGVINIITRRRRAPGIKGAIQASAGGHGRVNLGAGVTYASGPLSLTGSLGLRRDFRQREIGDRRRAVDPATDQTVISEETLHEHQQRTIPEAKAGFDYALNPHQSFGASASHQEVVNKRAFFQLDASQSATEAPLSRSERFNSGREWDQSTAQEVHFTQLFSRPGEQLTVQLQRSGQHERERYAYTNVDLLAPAPLGHDNLRLNLDLITTEASIDFVLPLPHASKLKAGYDFEENRNTFNDSGETLDLATGVWVPNPARTSRFDFRQQVHALYASYESVRGPWSVAAGGRIEDTTLRTLEPLSGQTGGQQYLRIYPNLRLERKLDEEQAVSFSASRRVNRPDPEAFNPFVDHQDIYNLRQGNPRLQPEDIVSLEAGYQRQHHNLGLGVTAFLRLSHGALTDVTRVVGPNVILTTKANLPSSRAAGLEATADGKLSQRISYAVTATLFYNQIDASFLGASGLRSTLGVNIKAHVDYKPTPVDTFQAAFSRSDRRLTTQGSIEAINLVNLGWRHQVTPKLTLIVTLSDALDGQTFRRHTITPTLDDVYTRHQLGQIIYGGLVYSFGGQAKAKPSSFEYEP